MIKLEENHEENSGEKIVRCIDEIVHSSFVDDAAKGNMIFRDVCNLWKGGYKKVILAILS